MVTILVDAIIRGIEIADFMARTSTLHITDLETVKSLDGSNVGETRFLTAPLFNNVIRLSITLRLPLPFCHALERPYNSHTSALEVDGDTQTWSQLGTTLTQLEKLRTLGIWLDHDEPCSWSVVNERSILSCLTPVIAIEGLDISISLPKLHPKYEEENRHFVRGSPIPFHLIRRRRQTSHGRKTDSQHGDEVIIQADFPVSQELIDLAIEVCDSPRTTVAEMEEIERRDWMSGMDVEASTRQMLDSLCGGCYMTL